MTMAHSDDFSSPGDGDDQALSTTNQSKVRSKFSNAKKAENAVIELLSDSDSDGNDHKIVRRLLNVNTIQYAKKPPSVLPSSSDSINKAQSKKRIITNPYAKKPPPETTGNEDKKPAAKIRKKAAQLKQSSFTKEPLQGGIVLEEDVEDCTRRDKNEYDSYIKEQKSSTTPALYHDPVFESAPASIHGSNRKAILKCRCSPAQPAKLSYKVKGPNKDRPYYHCAAKKCRYFSWAFSAERMHWYRFGSHNHHSLVNPTGFSANDLLQGKVGDCWFLSALAVIAERPDLILRLFPKLEVHSLGMVQVTLFMDGFWKTVVLDNFLPCIIDDKAEGELQQAIQASLGGGMVRQERQHEPRKSSKYDPFALSDTNRQVLRDTNEKLEQYRGKIVKSSSKALNRLVATNDLAYSKAKQQQLWVPFLEKAYAKIHGCYQAISGGHIAEAFLDLTGAPTLAHSLDGPSFDPRSFWHKLLRYRQQKLPMGCGTDSSAAGIIGMHAYSILDVREVRNVGVEFFREKLQTRSLGNVSGFTEFDGTVRLLHIRNPHGKGEWKGEFSDNSDTWERLLQNQTEADAGLQRSMKNDGCFWIDYDNFIMGFSNVDVVLAFPGNHAKSFASNFPEKKSNHRCMRAFEVSLLDVQPGVPSRDTIELYVMGIQKTKRGASLGRLDRKKSYKVCDLGMLVGEHCNKNTADSIEFETVEGRMFGFQRNGHYRLILDRRKNKSLVVMPISFGHPAATDADRSFALRFVSDAPLLIRELPSIPKMDRVLQTFCLRPNPSLVADWGQNQQGRKKLLLDDTGGTQKYGEPTFRVFQIDYLANRGGVVFVYLCVNEQLLREKKLENLNLCPSIEVKCRGMMCRIKSGFVDHETIAKGKKFQAAWRGFKCDFSGENKSRLLMILVQSGQDSELGEVTCRMGRKLSESDGKETTVKENALTAMLSVKPMVVEKDNYEAAGVFHGVDLPVNGYNHIFGPVACSASAGLLGDQSNLDMEMERALALSRDDTELQRALELSKGGPGRTSADDQSVVAIDVDLQRALEESTQANGKVVGVSSFDSDLQKAIAASTGPSSSCASELERAIQLSLQGCKRPTSVQPATIDLVDTIVSTQKRQKVNETITIDDEDDSGQVVSVEDKRRLAAEAAAKRFQMKFG